MTRIKKPILVQENPFSQLAVFILEIHGKNSAEGLTRVFSNLSSNIIVITSDTIKREDLEWVKNLSGFNLCGQQLSIIVLNWNHPEEFLFGRSGGGKLLDNFLKDQPTIMHLLKKQFEQLSCFLMPPEGHEKFTGSFEQVLARMIGRVYLTPKKINGEVMTCEQIPNLIQSYVCNSGQAESGLNKNEEAIGDILNLETTDADNDENDTNNLSAHEALAVLWNAEPTKQMNLEEYLQQSAEKSIKIRSDLSLTDNHTPKSPEEILQKYSNPKPVFQWDHYSGLDSSNLPEKTKLPEVSPPKDMNIPSATVEFLPPLFMNNLDQISRTDEITSASSGDDMRISTNQEIPEAGSVEYKPSTSADEPLLEQFEEILLEKIAQNFAKLSIHKFDKQAEEKCYQISLTETLADLADESKVEIFETNPPKEALTKCFHFWCLYDVEIRKILSSNDPPASKAELLRLFNFYCERSKDIMDQSMRSILTSKFRETYEHQLNQLEIQIQGMEYGISLAIKYYKSDMKTSPKLHPMNVEKILQCFHQACNFPNLAWKEYFTQKLSELLNKLRENEKPHDTPPDIIQPPTPDNIETLEMASANSLQAYKEEMQRIFRFQISPDIFVVDEGHGIAKASSLKKFHTYTASFNPDWTAKYQTELLEKIEENYSVFLRSADLKRQEYEERTSKITPIEQISSPADAGSSLDIQRRSKGFCGMHKYQNIIVTGLVNGKYKNCIRFEKNPTFGTPSIASARKHLMEKAGKQIDCCVIAISASSSKSDAEEIKKEATSAGGFENTVVIYETCAAAVFTLKTADICAPHLIVINCGGNFWTAALYEYRNHCLSLLHRLSDQSICVDKKININLETVHKLIDDVREDLKVTEVVLVGDQALIVKLKGILGIKKYGMVHLATVDNVLDGAVFYAVEIFSEKSQHPIEVCTKYELSHKFINPKSKGWLSFLGSLFKK